MDEDSGALTQRLGRWVPGVRAARTYDRSWLRADLVAGIVLAAILVPQGMAYAELAGLPAVTGLYTTIACLVGYALFGPSRVLVLGPDSSISPLILAALTPLVVAGDDPGKAIVLAGMLAILVGLVEIGLGLGKLGFVADLLSKEVQVGYMNGLLSDLPQAALAAVVVVAAFSLADLDVLRRYLRVRPSALAISLVATAGVILFGVLEGIVVAVVLAILLFFRRNWWPHGEVLGIADGLPGWHSVRANPGAREVPGVVVYRWEAPLIFANAGIFRQQIRHLVRDHQPEWVVLQCEAITDVDVTAAEMLEQLDNELNDAGIHMAFAEMRDRLQDLVLRYGLFETLDRGHFYPTLDTAIAAVEAESRDATPRA